MCACVCAHAQKCTRDLAQDHMRIKRRGGGADTCKVAEALGQSIMEPGGLIKFHPHPGACQSNGGGAAAKRTSGERATSRDTLSVTRQRQAVESAGPRAGENAKRVCTWTILGVAVEPHHTLALSHNHHALPRAASRAMNQRGPVGGNSTGACRACTLVCASAPASKLARTCPTSSGEESAMAAAVLPGPPRSTAPRCTSAEVFLFFSRHWQRVFRRVLFFF